MTDFAVDAISCYYCDNIEATEGPEGCQGFNETAMTNDCADTTYCLSAYGKAINPTNKEIEIHGCTFPDNLEGKYL